MILVTGGTGFLGSELIKQLTDSGLPVRALKRNQSKVPKILLNNDLITWVNADINETEALADAFESITQVYHCAAFVSLNDKDKKQLFHVNIKGTANVVNMCLQYQCKLLHVSSIAALGEAKKGLCINEENFFQYDTKIYAYGLSKYEAEMEVWRGIHEGLQAVIVNPSVIIGKNAGFEGSGSIFKLVKGGFAFYTNGATGFVDVSDVAAAMIALMHSEICGERFILSSENYHFKELFTAIAKGFGVAPPKKEIKAWMLGVAWRALKLTSLFTGKTPSITKETAESSVTISCYENKKVINAIGIKFKPVAESISEITQYLKNV